MAGKCLLVSHAHRWERLNEAETRLIVDSPALPARAPTPAVTALTTAARGGGLWLALSVAEALRPGGDRRMARHAGASVLAALATAHVAKRVAPDRARPEPPGGVARHTLPEQPRSSSFPSAHAATAAAWATVVLTHHGRRGALVLPLPLVVIYSRVRARVHWPTDALAGTALGIAVAALIRNLRSWSRTNRSPGW